MDEELDRLLNEGPKENQTVEEWARAIVMKHKEALEDGPIEIPEENVEALVQIIVESFHRADEE